MGTIRPFETKGFFVIHNAVFDTIMPNISPNGFKILCTAIRLTLGWHKESDLISYSQFLDKTGIKSRSTVSSAIQECLDKGFLLRIEQEKSTNLGKPSFFYCLNVDFELENSSTENGLENNPSTVFGLDSSTEIGLDSSTVFGHTKRQQDNQHADDDVLQTLISFGIEQAVAKKLIKQGVSLELLESWINYTETHNDLRNPVGFVVSRLKLGEYPPQSEPVKEQSEFVTCPECYRVHHKDDVCPNCGKCVNCCTCEN